jgi:hypothetical protein
MADNSKCESVAKKLKEKSDKTGLGLFNNSRGE